MATIPHPAVALADQASLDVDRQNGAIAALNHFARGGAAANLTRPDAWLILDRLADLARAASAAGWLDDREAADTTPGEAA